MTEHAVIPQKKNPPVQGLPMKISAGMFAIVFGIREVAQERTGPARPFTTRISATSKSAVIGADA
jgi:hypothetical protein